MQIKYSWHLLSTYFLYILELYVRTDGWLTEVALFSPITDDNVDTL